jgi:hypothetical protein
VRWRWVILLAVLALLSVAVVNFLWRREAYSAVQNVEVLGINPPRARLYSRVEIDVNVTGYIGNQFDPEDVNVTAFITDPEGKVLALPAFYYQDYRRVLLGNTERLEPVGQPCWKVRFTPVKAGRYEFYVEAVSKGSSKRTPVYSFEVEPSGQPGFARVSGRDSRYFEFDNGSSNFFVGLDVCWSGSRGTYDYDEWFRAMAASGVNLVRIWMAPWRFGIEWRQLGRYDLEEAWRLDYVLELAERYGIRVILCLMNHGQLSTQANPQWSENPYNKARGGPLSKPEEFWTSEEARKLFKKRLRYIVARWGYSTSLLAWELWNEVDLTDNYMSVRENVARWHAEMAAYLKRLDPYKRMVTTSFANPNLDPLVWQLGEIDFITVHKYGPEGFQDVAGTLYDIVRRAWERYRKPVLVTEFGVDWRWEGLTDKPLYYLDREGVGLHDGLWATVMAGSPATAMSWWWDNYIHPYNLYYHFKAVADFLKGIDPAASGFKRLETELMLPTDLSGEEISDAVVYPSLGWARPLESFFEVKLDGTVEGDTSQIPTFIQGASHPDLRNNPTFRVTFPRGGRVVVHVNSVSRAGAVLAVYVDGVLAKRVELPDRDGKYDAFAREYDTDVVLEVPQGVHEIRLDNLGVDWYTIDYVRFEGAALKKAKVRVYGLTNGTLALAWVKNPDASWWKIVRNESFEPARDVAIKLIGLADGEYKVEIWDTWKGSVKRSWLTKTTNGVLVVNLEEVVYDLAIKAVKTS